MSKVIIDGVEYIPKPMVGSGIEYLHNPIANPFKDLKLGDVFKCWCDFGSSCKYTVFSLYKDDKHCYFLSQSPSMSPAYGIEGHSLAALSEEMYRAYIRIDPNQNWKWSKV